MTLNINCLGFNLTLIHTEFKVNVITYATNLISIHLEESNLWHLTAFKLCVACSEVAIRKKKSSPLRECLKKF